MGGVVHRRPRPRPKDWTLPVAASELRALCTLRWLVPSATARAELDQASPSARKANTAAWSSSTGHASVTTSSARRGVSANPCFVAVTLASVRSTERSRAASTRKRARCDSSACCAPNTCATSLSLDTSPGHASPSARPSANSTGRVASEITLLFDAQRDGTRQPLMCSTPAQLRPVRAGGAAHRRSQSVARQASSG